jgi:hypothetical protein
VAAAVCGSARNSIAKTQQAAPHSIVKSIFPKSVFIILLLMIFPRSWDYDLRVAPPPEGRAPPEREVPMLEAPRALVA